MDYPCGVSVVHRTRRIEVIEEALRLSSNKRTLTFDYSLFKLYKDGLIDLVEALNKADSRADLEAKMHFGG